MFHITETPENPTLTSKNEYLRNKVQKRTNVIDLKPEVAGMTDKRIAERSFNLDNELRRSVKIVSDAKALRLNRRQMFKNAQLEHSYEPAITTKQVSKVLDPEVDLPSLRQSFQNTVNSSRRSTTVKSPLNILTH